MALGINDAATVGKAAMWLTIAYVTVFMGREAWQIVRTKTAPRLGVLLPQAACFAAWSYYAYLSVQPSIYASNLVGMFMSLLLAGLALWAKRQRRGLTIDDAVPQTKTDEASESRSVNFSSCEPTNRRQG